MEDGLLFGRDFNLVALRCIVGDDVDKVLKEIHVRDCGEHQ